jgi:hypothetical protein
MIERGAERICTASIHIALFAWISNEAVTSLALPDQRRFSRLPATSLMNL